MTRYLAEWVVPVSSPPIPHGYVDVDVNGVVRAVGRSSEAHPLAAADGCVELAEHIVCPSLVNAHTHLELSQLRGRVSPTDRMPEWARDVMSRSAQGTHDAEQIREAIADAHASGTGLVGDISNTLASVEPLRDSPVDGIVFKELLGFNVRNAVKLVEEEHENLVSRETRADVRLALAAHAPYSVSPALFQAIRDANAEFRFGPLSVHLAESREELEFLETGSGIWRDVLESRSRWDASWHPFGGGPLAYIGQWGWVAPNVLVVHGVHLTDAELGRLASAGATLVTCPRSNQWTGAGRPPVERFYRSGVRVAVGTDSLASVPDLSVFHEMAELRRLGPAVPASAIVRSATLVGAESLGFPDRGAIAPGMRSRLIAVAYAGRLDDVEEYLVSGVEPDQVTWLE